MPVVTDQLRSYWNAKDYTSGTTMRNINPFPLARTLSFVGATKRQSDGALYFDGVDDYMSLTQADAIDFRKYDGSWAFEMIMTPENIASSQQFIGGSSYMDTYIEPGFSNIYAQFFPSTAYADGHNISLAVPELRVKQLTQLLIQFDFPTKTIEVYANGVLKESKVMTVAVGMAYAGALQFWQGAFSGFYNGYFHAMRVYHKKLSQAEITQNWNNGKEIGLSVPQVKIAELRSSGQLIPIYALSGHESEPFRVVTSDGLGFIPLVLTTDPNASKIRVQTSKGLRAFKK